MSSPPLPSAPLAESLGWLAAEVRAEKEEAGRIAALLMEVFARLIAGLAGFAARLEAGTLVPPEAGGSRAPSTPTPASARVASALLPRVFGWLGGLLPVGGAMAFPPIAAASQAEQPGTQGVWLRAPAPPRARIAAQGGRNLRARDSAVHAAAVGDGRKRLHVPARALPAPEWVRAQLVAWRRLPASTAWPLFSKIVFP